MTFEEFLKYVRDHVGDYCSDRYWEHNYKMLKDKSETGVKKEMPYLAIHAIATDYAYKNG